MEESELRKLLRTKNGCRVPAMPPVPDVNVMNKLPFTPIPHYNRLREKQQKFRQVLEERATQRKVEIAKPPLQRRERDRLEIAQERHIAVIRECAEKTKPPSMLKTWERKIMSLVPPKLLEPYPTVTEAVIRDSKEEWDRNLHELAVRTVIRDIPGVPRKRYVEPFFKYNGITPNYERMMKFRKKLQDGSLLFHPFIRLIIESAERMFPEFIINLAKFRANGPIPLPDFESKIMDQIRRADHLVSSTWFGVLVQWLKNPRCLRGMRPKKIPDFIRCATKLISMQIQELMRRSINAIISAMLNPDQVPILNLDLDFVEEFEYDKTLQIVYETFHNIADAISTIAQRLMPIEEYLRVPYVNDCLPVKYNDWLYNDGHERLQQALDGVFAPLIAYQEHLREHYNMLYGVSAREALEAFIAKQHEFEIGRTKILYFQNIGYDITAMLENEYFNCAVVCQLRMIDGLKRRVSNFVNSIIAGIVKTHMEENDNICAEFEEIAAKALKDPANAAELVEQGNYILYAKTILVEILKGRIMRQINIVSNLLELTELSEEHVESNTRTVNWLKKIKPIFDKNAAAYEQHKAEMEENLLAKIAFLNKEVKEMAPFLELLDYMDDVDHTLEYLEYLRKLVHRLHDCDALVAWINNEEATFKFPITHYPDLEELKEYIIPFHSLVHLVHRWKRSYFTWMDGPFEYMDHNQIEYDHDFYYKEFLKISKNYRNKIKQQIAEGVEKRFAGLVEDLDVNMQPAPMKLCAQAIAELKEWRPNVQMAHIMCNRALMQRHWDEMTLIAGFDLTPTAGTTLRKIIDFDLWDKIDEYEIISVAATKELALITNLNKMIAEWADICFKTSPYKDTGINILSGLDDIQSILDDHIVKTIGMRGSAFVKPFETQVRTWYEKIVRVNATIDEWGKVQSQWLYLLPIFSSKDIVAQMPEEGVMFVEVNNIYRRYMGSVEKDPHALDIAGASGVLEQFKIATALLEKINDGVNNYLERKRLYFPRFFFLSNDEMLEILSETKNPLKVQPHLKKCFEGINRLVFDPDFFISAMVSMETEQIEFVEQINVQAARGSVEKWLVQVEDQMLKAVRSETELSYYDYPTLPRADWILSWEGMVVLAVSQIYWAVDVHEALNTHKLSNLQAFHKSLTKQLNETVGIVRRPTLSKLSSITVKALIVIDVHAKDVIMYLVGMNVTEVTDFQWLAQLRYYWEEERVNVKIINAIVKFAYEYLGNSDRLVITPLTDRCYRTLVGAYYLHLNGAPEGPAGTGKTETTKDLAKALAVQCVVFNCSDGLDYKAMGKFFKGLASCGAWVCFDEFNRIDVEVLSVIAQQILCIVQAVRQKLETFLFEGTTLTLNPACYVCITMNPGYAGRSELPDNLKVLFRTVAMMVPDYAMIGEISLYSFGFFDARNLSVKIVTTYRLCSEQLSSQNHYDYGMRAVKTVLSAAGNLKRSFPNENESILLLRSITDVNLPKFLSFDVPLFEGIISDLFPGIVLPKPDYENLLNACNEVCKNNNLQAVDCFLLKVIQTFEMMIVRHGYMLVGDPFSGKSMTLKVLAEALTLMHERNIPGGCECMFKVLNPKAVTMGQLYGAFDPISYEWTDGIVATMFRDFTTEDTPVRKWIVFDGPVDAVWIENMNTVLDDNKKLCLTSGEVMAMSNVMSMIFEVMDLSQASPATVSRCGMIYMESSSFGFEPFYKSWTNTLNPIWYDENEEYIFTMCEWLFEPLIYYVRKYCGQLVTAGEVNLVISTLRLVVMLMDDAIEGEEDTRYTRTWFTASMMTALVWGVGGILNSDSRNKFDEIVKEYFRGDNGFPGEIDRIDVSIPTEGMIFEHYYMYKGKGCWKPWPEAVKAVQIKEQINLLQTVVPTLETEKYMYILRLHVEFCQPLLLIGPTGTGKSFYIQSYLMNKIDMEKYVPGFLTFTTTTSCNLTQELVLSKLIKRRKNNYGPPKGKKAAVIFIDDMNMPAKETYGAQPAIELLRLYFDQGHWYDLKSTEKLYIWDTFFVGAIGPVGGSRQLIYPRMLRHYNIYSINEFSKESMTKIFTTLLQLGWRRNGFGQDAQPFIVNIITSTMEIYGQAIEGLRPTPAKSHYIFNLRDFSRVIQGCALLRKESAENKKTFVRVWIHEVMRVFYDRLVDARDRTWFFNILKKITFEYMKIAFETAMDTYQVEETGEVPEAQLKKLMFGCYLDLESLEGERRYDELPSKETFLNIAIAMLVEYNALHKAKMNIVLFDYALEHLSKICRVLSMPMGNALLVGVGGSGRQSLCRLASTVLGQSLFQPEITKAYSVKDWQDDIKIVLRESGGLNKDTTFLFTESQIKEEVFIQNLDSLLNSGEVPNMYGLDEKQEILELCRLAAQGGNRNLDISPLQILAFFVGRCRAKLHICLCFSPIGSAFRLRLRLYPSLVNCCTIDWYDDWPEDALEMVANYYMVKVNVPDKVKSAAVIACKQFHVDSRRISDDFYSQFGRKTYITSASYLDLIKSFTTLTNRKQRELKAARLRYTNGLDKLNMAAEAVSIMQHDLNELKPQLIIMAEKSAKMMKEIEEETAEADKAAAQVREDQKVANVQAAAAQELKKDCEADLALALPILEDAIAALNTLKPADITIVKSMKNPPATVKLVMAAVCVIKQVAPDRIPDPNNPGKKIMDFWGPSKRILGDMQFLESLRNFDKDNIPIDVMKKIRKEYLSHKDFKPHIIAKSSSAAEGLCKWIIAMDMYDAVAKVVAPKKAKLEAAEREFAETMAILEEKKATVARLEAKLAELNEALEEANIKKKALEDEVQLCIDKLYRAEKLIGGLGGEKVRWTAAAENLQTLFDNLAGDILVSCGIIAYLAPYTHPVRVNVIDDWRDLVIKLEMPHSEVYVLKDILGTDIKIQNWCIAGLPRDSFSIDNGIILNNSMRWSLMVDPQGQANKWVKTMEKANDLQVLKFTDGNYMKVIETCLEYGKPALIETVQEDVEAPLDPILLKQTYHQGGKEFIALGENVLEYHPNFRLYMTTKLRNPHYLPEIFNKVTLINFVLTKEGLEDQLLGIVVAKERPDLQEKREKLIVQGAANRAALKQVEDDILRTLQETKGDILEDETAVDVLDNSKILAIDIMKKQEASVETEEIIEKFRLGYRPIASHSAILYYCVTELPNVDPMYQYSLTWFIYLYIISIENANKSKDLEKRLKFLKETFTYNLYSNVCRSLFDKDKLMFSFIMCSKMMLATDEMDHSEYLFLITGGIATENPYKNPTDWLPDKGWDEICRIIDLPTYKDFKEDFIPNARQWKKVYDDMEPHNVPLPGKWDTKLTAFQKLLIIRFLRPDKLTIAISEFVEKQMGKKFITPPPFDIGKSFGDSNCLAPLIFILSPGSDPMGALIKYCERMGYSNKFNSISLGQGQGPIAKAMIEKAQLEGGWVCLQNCHLAVSWLSTLEKTIEGFDLTNTDLSFRLWLTSYPSDKFPQAVLQNGVKMTNEPPTGLQHNLHRSYISEPLKETEFYEGCPGKDKTFSKLLYGISFFHAVVQERKKFGPLGWNIQYGFNDSDFHISVMQLQMFLNQYEEIQYVAIKYLTGECNYGGRVTDDWDRRLIVTILDNYVNSGVVNDPNYLFCDIGPQYGLPRRCEYQDYLKHIETVPVNPPPEAFGLHMNAGITRDYRVSMEIVGSLVLVEGGGGGGEGGNTEAVLIHMAAEIVAKLPPLYDIETGKKKYPVDYNESMNTVLIQEMERFNKLNNEIKNSLNDLQKAVKGLIVMSPALDMQSNAMLLGQIPQNWRKVSYPSLKPLPSYVADFVERLEMLQDWYDNGKPPTFWLSGFFFTQAFLTGSIQNYARAKKIPIDLLVFDFEVRHVDYENESPEWGVYVQGLFMDGGRWDRDSFAIAEQFPKILNDNMPALWLYPKMKQEFEEGSRYKCPLYKTLERKGVLATTGHSSNFVLAFYLPSDKPAAHWIQRSVALLLQLDN
ncbi:dynein axonemal heavy chain 12 [Pectinophora gossypiella]|uniref:dynein axonemal heavy chain 12 n=1 Tax=Pectinophora gossypiella TaxID=13191 RepID=UPI00214EAF10|nr:dynein axonemal heavy chain 12 [Pectinophora gossypiella]